MNITVVGAGNVGRALGNGWAAAGHTVSFGVRDVQRYDDLPGAAPLESALAGADVIVLALPGGAVDQLIDDHSDALDGALLIDATNDVRASEFSHVTVLRERLPQARVVRAFSTVGFEVMADPVIGGERADLFWCGPEDEDGARIGELITDLGLRPVRLGDLDAVGLLDALTRVWFTLSRTEFGRHHALRVLSD